MTSPTTHTLEVPGAVLTYDVRPGESRTSSPSGAELVLLLTYQPRGA